jgi:CO/xanthine dehydrogenase FAD-binding subunit
MSQLPKISMPRALAVIAIIALILSLGSTFLAIWTDRTAATKDLLDLTKLLLSWPIISGGLVVGGATVFRDQIKDRLKRPQAPTVIVETTSP